MSELHAVVWVDHQHAQVLHIDGGTVQVRKIKAHTHHTSQHGSQVRTEHEFFGEVCDALVGHKGSAGDRRAQGAGRLPPLRRQTSCAHGTADCRLGDRRSPDRRPTGGPGAAIFRQARSHGGDSLRTIPVTGRMSHRPAPLAAVGGMLSMKCSFSTLVAGFALCVSAAGERGECRRRRSRCLASRYRPARRPG